MSYYRNVFLGLAQDKLNKNADAENAYLGATGVKYNDKPAWQGLISLYEKQGSYKLESYRKVVLRLGEIFAEAYVIVLLILRRFDLLIALAMTNTAVRMSWINTSTSRGRMAPARNTNVPSNSTCLHVRSTIF